MDDLWNVSEIGSASDGDSFPEDCRFLGTEDHGLGFRVWGFGFRAKFTILPSREILPGNPSRQPQEPLKETTEKGP